MTVVVGTAGHIDHGKTTLLRALTGIDADRLPEEQRRGMTIDVGYAHLVLPGGASLDFVDVPGHDGLVGNMLVGAGEIDAAMLVVAADDGPRAQTLEHLELLDALGIRRGLAVVTKADLVDDDRLADVRAEVARLLEATGLAGVPVLAVSAQAGTGLELLTDELARLERNVPGGSAGPSRLAIDRRFSVRGRGTVVTGSLRGPGLTAGDTLRLEPAGGTARIREVQVHGVGVAGRVGCGRTALNLAGVEAASLRRGQVLTAGPGVEVGSRLLVVLRRSAGLAGGADREARFPPDDGVQARLHAGTAQVGVRVGRSGREATLLADGRCTAILRLDEPVALAPGDRFVLRRLSPGLVLAGGIVLDALPPRGLARRRVTPGRLVRLTAALADGATQGAVAALLDLHGALPRVRAQAVAAVTGAGWPPSSELGDLLVAPDVRASLEDRVLAAVIAHHAAAPLSPGAPVAEIRRPLALDLQRQAGTDERTAATAASALIDSLVTTGRLAREGDRLRDPARRAGLPPELEAAMARLEALLATSAPPALDDAARSAGCPPDGVRALEAAGRIVRLEADLAYAAPAYHRLAAQALAMARTGPLAPAAFRDATGTSRRYVLAVLEDLDRRGILRRTPEGHIPGPKAPAQAPLPPAQVQTSPVHAAPAVAAPLPHGAEP